MSNGLLSSSGGYHVIGSKSVACAVHSTGFSFRILDVSDCTGSVCCDPTVVAPPPVFLFCTAAFSICCIGTCVELEGLAFRGCSLMGLASVSLFCTVNRSSFQQ